MLTDNLLDNGDGTYTDPDTNNTYIDDGNGNAVMLAVGTPATYGTGYGTSPGTAPTFTGAAAGASGSPVTSPDYSGLTGADAFMHSIESAFTSLGTNAINAATGAGNTYVNSAAAAANAQAAAAAQTPAAIAAAAAQQKQMLMLAAVALAVVFLIVRKS